MIILSWNIQKINREKAAQFAPIIGGVINEVAGNQPFVLVVYENKTSPDEVLSSIGSGLQGSQLTYKWVGTGGSTGLRENILLVAGNGATFDDPGSFEDWHQDFDNKCQQMHQQEILSAQAQVNRLNAVRPARSSTATGRQNQLATAVQGTYQPAENFRSPVVITARANGETTKFLALHAPGPSSGDDHEEPFARTFAEAVLRNAGDYDMVLGDFNLRTHEIDSGGFVDQSVRLGATTKGSEDGRHTWSRLDRVYTRPGLEISTALISDGQERELTDHHCLAIRVEPRRPQTLITSYFAYEPSPLRQQEVVYENRQNAFAARVDNLQPDDDSSDSSNMLEDEH